jgi:hypothetical protein
MTRPILTIAATLLGCTAGIASAQIGAPQSGLVLDASLQAIRPVLGLPGAWTLGPALDLGIPVLGARFEKDFAVIISDGTIGSNGNPTNVAVVKGSTVTPVDGAAAADLITLNATGNAALLYSKNGRIIQWLQGLPDHPTVARTISLADLAGDVTALAVNRGGDFALIGLDSGSLYKIPVDGDLSFVGNIHAASIVFAANDRDAYLTDSAAGVLMLASDGQGLSVLADSSAGLQQPGAMQIVGNTNLLIASPVANLITCFDVTHGTASTGALPLSALQIDRLGADGLLLLNQPGSGPLYVLDGSSVSNGNCAPAVLFIPPGAVRSARHGGR